MRPATKLGQKIFFVLSTFVEIRDPLGEQGEASQFLAVRSPPGEQGIHFKSSIQEPAWRAGNTFQVLKLGARPYNRGIHFSMYISSFEVGSPPI